MKIVDEYLDVYDWQFEIEELFKAEFKRRYLKPTVEETLVQIYGRDRFIEELNTLAAEYVKTGIQMGAKRALSKLSLEELKELIK